MVTSEHDLLANINKHWFVTLVINCCLTHIVKNYCLPMVSYTITGSDPGEINSANRVYSCGTLFLGVDWDWNRVAYPQSLVLARLSIHHLVIA